MNISDLALAAKKVIDAAWLHGDAYDLSSQAAFALESAQLLQSPESAQLVDKMCAALNGHEPPVPGETPMETVTRFAVRLMETERELAELVAERHTTNEVLDDAANELRARTEDVTPQVTKLRALLAGQRDAVEDPNGLHHDYRPGRDLPMAGA